MGVLSANSGGLALGGLGGFVAGGLRGFDWPRRRMKELLRDGRVSAWLVVKGCKLGGAVVLGAVMWKEAGAGKSLKAGS